MPTLIMGAHSTSNIQTCDIGMSQKDGNSVDSCMSSGIIVVGDNVFCWSQQNVGWLKKINEIDSTGVNFVLAQQHFRKLS
jgi:hypothetical protein